MVDFLSLLRHHWNNGGQRIQVNVLKLEPVVILDPDYWLWNCHVVGAVFQVEHFIEICPVDFIGKHLGHFFLKSTYLIGPLGDFLLYRVQGVEIKKVEGNIVISPVWIHSLDALI